MNKKYNTEEERKKAYNERFKKYREKNKEKRAEYNKKYYEENKTKILEYSKEYYAKNKVILKPALGYEDKFKVNNKGLVYSIPRRGTKGGFLKPRKDGNGYLFVFVEKNKMKKIAHLVWEAFNGEIPKGYDVHHINHNRQDNRLENLCLMLSSDHRKLHNEEKSKQVAQYDLEGNLIKIYPSVMEAERQTGVGSSHISSCCKGGKYKSAGGSVWQYVA